MTLDPKAYDETMLARSSMNAEIIKRPLTTIRFSKDSLVSEDYIRIGVDAKLKI